MKISEIPYTDTHYQVAKLGYIVWDQTPDSSGGTYEEATLQLPQGIVSIYMQGHLEVTRPYSRVFFVHNGRSYSRAWRHRFTRKTIRRLAWQFVEEVTAITTQEKSHQ